MSLYEVSDIVPGNSLRARVRSPGGEPIAVSAESETLTLKQWNRIAARIVPVLGKNIFAGGLLPDTRQAIDALFDDLRQVFGKKGTKNLPAVADHATLQYRASPFQAWPSIPAISHWSRSA